MLTTNVPEENQSDEEGTTQEPDSERPHICCSGDSLVKGAEERVLTL